MENLYNYVFWYNSYQELWYAIETTKYTEFMSGHLRDENTLTSNKIETLIELINNPTRVPEE